MAPFVALTPWRRTLPTWVHPESDLYTLNPDYVRGVEQAGGRAAILPHGAPLDGFDALVLTGGADLDPAGYGHENVASMSPDPASDTSDLGLATAARSLGIPVLAICRGMQVAAVANGGTLHQHIWTETGPHAARNDTGDPAADADEFLGRRHDVALEPDSVAARLFGTTTVATNSLHHQAVEAPGDGLRITGRAADGVAEVLEADDGRLLGVQWHPERLLDEGHQVLFDWLVSTARG